MPLDERIEIDFPAGANCQQFESLFVHSTILARKLDTSSVTKTTSFEWVFCEDESAHGNAGPKKTTAF